MDRLTKKSTLFLDRGFKRVARPSGSARDGRPERAVVFIGARCDKERRKLKPTDDVVSVIAKTHKMMDLGLEACAAMAWCQFPLRGTAGLFEIKKNGVRLYGGRVDTIDGVDCLVLLAAEQKAGKAGADRALLDRCSTELRELQDSLSCAGE